VARLSKADLVCRWIERLVVHGPGEKTAQPFRLEGFHRDIIGKLYAEDASGNRDVRQALIGLPKGSGKTELMAAIALAELASPVAPPSPEVIVAAASYEQAGVLFDAASTMVREGPLNEFLDVYENRILLKSGIGQMRRIAAAAGTVDGLKPTCFIADELHEWVGSKARVHLVVSNGLVKRSGVESTSRRPGTTKSPCCTSCTATAGRSSRAS
jgi:phage terminase large subunit-like protein